MFGKRVDGVRVKGLAPFYKIVPYVMKKRSDAQVFFEDKIYLDEITSYIRKKREEDIKIGHMDIMIAAMAKLLYQRPNLNRFIMNRKIYKRNEVVISLAVKKKLVDEAIETTIKFKINPDDNLFTIANQIDEKTADNKKEEIKNNTDKLARIIMSFPNMIIKGIVGFIQFLDNHEMIPKKIVEASPFHTSTFITNMGSLGINSIYHHIYDFGTTSTFIAMGTKKYEKDVEGNTRGYIDIKVVADERICDGLYYARSFSLLKKYIEDPELLEKNMIE